MKQLNNKLLKDQCDICWGGCTNGTCDECPGGFTGDGIDCFDVDECEQGRVKFLKNLYTNFLK